MIMNKSGMVSNDNQANNSLKKYFNTLGNFMGIDPSENNIAQSEQTYNLNNLNDDNDTEDEDDIPELKSV